MHISVYQLKVCFALIIVTYFQASIAQAQTDKKLLIEPLAGNFYVYTTYNTYQNSKVRANGVYLVTKKGVVIFDTPWDTTQFQPLLDSIQSRHKKKLSWLLLLIGIAIKQQG